MGGHHRYNISVSSAYYGSVVKLLFQLLELSWEKPVSFFIVSDER